MLLLLRTRVGHAGSASVCTSDLERDAGENSKKR